MATTLESLEVRLAMHHCVGATGNSDRVAGFLTAVRQMNTDPTTFLGNASFRVRPFFQECTDFGDEFKVGQVRSMAKLVSRDGRNVNSTDAIGAALQGRDVHVVVSGGRSSELIRTAPVADINAKHVVSFTATSDALSNTGRPPPPPPPPHCHTHTHAPPGTSYHNHHNHPRVFPALPQ
jgi:hypothetical protein